MLAGLLGLAFNPSAWIAVGMALFLGFSGGVVKGWADSKADRYRAEVVELRRASARKDAIIKADAERYLADQAETARLEDQLKDILNATDTASLCAPTDDDFSKLRKL